MEPIPFKEHNVIYAENQSDYKALPAHRVQGDPAVTVICCWQLTEEEIEQVKKTGVIWHSIATFNNPLQPQHLSTESPFITGYDNEKDT